MMKVKAIIERFTVSKVRRLDAFENLTTCVISRKPASPLSTKIDRLCVMRIISSIEEVIRLLFRFGDWSGGLLVKAAVAIQMEKSGTRPSHLFASQGVLPKFSRPARAHRLNKEVFQKRDFYCNVAGRQKTANTRNRSKAWTLLRSAMKRVSHEAISPNLPCFVWTIARNRPIPMRLTLMEASTGS